MDRAFLVVIALFLTTAAHADDSAVRLMLQSKYDAAKGLSGVTLGSSFRTLDVRGKPIHPNYPLNARITVGSADMLDETAKACVKVRFSLGPSVVVREELHTWLSSGGTWKLVETRITSYRSLRNGRIVAQARDTAPTDWHRTYGRDATWKCPLRYPDQNGRRF